MAHPVGILVVPFPAHGHLNQLLHFSLHLSSHNLPVHFAASATHNRQARDRIQGWNSTSVDKVHFHDLQIPPFSTPPPDPDAVIKFPAHLQPMFEASDHLRSPLLDLFRLLSGTYERLVVVHDPLMSFAGIDAVTVAQR
ncbi:cis-zeatin O-glucosyltransferase 2-like [Asparagus officinalis]|uniref:cis-zeatin O-glucosyltransferase 2-like n=1 Tax=Asparagus officinalis TaxID=4686 RepID=UPI00098E0748|nr:cis-zeatin O-glucosyltransferase 2-like [Asparagus officinalis]